MACRVAGMSVRVEMRKCERKGRTAEADVYGAAVQYEGVGELAAEC